MLSRTGSRATGSEHAESDETLPRLTAELTIRRPLRSQHDDDREGACSKYAYKCDPSQDCREGMPLRYLLWQPKKTVDHLGQSPDDAG